jgi:hypothetical protein
MNNGVLNDFFPRSCTYEIVDAKRRILFLLCLQHANNLPQLPLELVVDISKRITKSVYLCFICKKFVEKSSEFYRKGIFVFCSNSCFDRIQRSYKAPAA